MIIGEDETVRLTIAFNPRTWEVAITNDNAKNVAQMQMILDEAVRAMNDQRQKLAAQAHFKELQDQIIRQQVMASNARH